MSKRIYCLAVLTTLLGVAALAVPSSACERWLEGSAISLQLEPYEGCSLRFSVSEDSLVWAGVEGLHREIVRLPQRLSGSGSFQILVYDDDNPELLVAHLEAGEYEVYVQASRHAAAHAYLALIRAGVQDAQPIIDAFVPEGRTDRDWFTIPDSLTRSGVVTVRGSIGWQYDIDKFAINVPTTGVLVPLNVGSVDWVEVHRRETYHRIWRRRYLGGYELGFPVLEGETLRFAYHGGYHSPRTGTWEAQFLFLSSCGVLSTEQASVGCPHNDFGTPIVHEILDLPAAGWYIAGFEITNAERGPTRISVRNSEFPWRAYLYRRDTGELIANADYYSQEHPSINEWLEAGLYAVKTVTQSGWPGEFTLRVKQSLSYAEDPELPSNEDEAESWCTGAGTAVMDVSSGFGSFSGSIQRRGDVDAIRLVGIDPDLTYDFRSAGVPLSASLHLATDLGAPELVATESLATGFAYWTSEEICISVARSAQPWLATVPEDYVVTVQAIASTGTATESSRGVLRATDPVLSSHFGGAATSTSNPAARRNAMLRVATMRSSRNIALLKAELDGTLNDYELRADLIDRAAEAVYLVDMLDEYGPRPTLVQLVSDVGFRLLDHAAQDEATQTVVAATQCISNAWGAAVVSAYYRGAIAWIEALDACVGALGEVANRFNQLWTSWGELREVRHALEEELLVHSILVKHIELGSDWVQTNRAFLVDDHLTMSELVDAVYRREDFDAWTAPWEDNSRVDFVAQKIEFEIARLEVLGL